LSIITVRVPKEVKRKLERRRVNVSETVRTLLERYVGELELRDLASRLELLKERLGGRIDAELVARAVREDREAR
jgi:hypothetical protein